ncbi:hypothetical protein [Flavobacterium lindanitolerans]|jgi:hypothetical protein|uniref:hypothetical protein n=1 Tax=Flavobacterium lindanitolerans TaxID=428988 RepID=UPI0023F38248|nr:hypothetical protein [Flavobacterium lindanitolerans]
MKTKFISIIILFCILSCSQQKQAFRTDKKATIINQSEYINWIAGKEYKPLTPTQSELEQIDIILQDALSKGEFYFLKEQTLKELKNRYRQYICYINGNGDKIVYVNSFCKIPTIYDDDGKAKLLDWKNEMVDTADGGSCYWNMKINLTKNTYYELIINGNS